MKKWNRETLTLALLIALLPPLWAVLAPMGLGNLGTTPLQIAAAMLVGVWYVGVALDAAHRKIRG